MLNKRQKEKPQRDGLSPKGPHTYFPLESGDTAQEHLGSGRFDLPLPQLAFPSLRLRVSSGSDL